MGMAIASMASGEGWGWLAMASTCCSCQAMVVGNFFYSITAGVLAWRPSPAVPLGAVSVHQQIRLDGLHAGL
jgi:hypothetical protein